MNTEYQLPRPLVQLLATDEGQCIKVVLTHAPTSETGTATVLITDSASGDTLESGTLRIRSGDMWDYSTSTGVKDTMLNERNTQLVIDTITDLIVIHHTTHVQPDEHLAIIHPDNQDPFCAIVGETEHSHSDGENDIWLVATYPGYQQSTMDIAPAHDYYVYEIRRYLYVIDHDSDLAANFTHCYYYIL